MLSMAVQSGLATASLCSSFPSQKSSLMHLKTRPSFIAPQMFHNQPISHRPISRNRKITALAAPETLTTEPSAVASDASQPPEKAMKVVVKQVERPRLVLKFIWMEKNIGLALDQQVPGHGTIPLSPYFFWPRKDAWEELKSTLESKPWISQKTMIILLNQATDIINLWQQSGGNLTSQ